MARVLVVDDDLTVLGLVAGFLEASGHEVLRAADGAEAREALHRGDVEVVVTDLHMPRLDGFGLVEHVRGLPQLVPVVMISGTWTAEERTTASSLGVARLHSKPVDLAQLARDVDELA